MTPLLEDELCHVRQVMRPVSLSDLVSGDFSGDVILHNTMRFDVSLAYAQPIIDDGDLDIASLATEIRDAIHSVVKARLERSTGVKGICDYPFGGVVKKSVMLHRETLVYDLS